MRWNFFNEFQGSIIWYCNEAAVRTAKNISNIQHDRNYENADYILEERFGFI
jgi:hypothetical protein